MKYLQPPIKFGFSPKICEIFSVPDLIQLQTVAIFQFVTSHVFRNDTVSIKQKQFCEKNIITTPVLKIVAKLENKNIYCITYSVP